MPIYEVNTLYIAVLLLVACATGKTDRTTFSQNESRCSHWPTDNTNCWIFLAGQSKYGRARTDNAFGYPGRSADFALTADNEFVLAKEPLHWYEPETNGFDCGLSLAAQS